MTTPAVPRPQRCSDAARDRHDPALGTAPAGTRWFLIEQDGDWAPQVLDSVDAPAEARQSLHQALGVTGARAQLVRRPGTRGADRRTLRRWGVVDSALGVEVWGDREPDGGWGGALEALLDPVAAGASAGPGVLLVCTHGKHDACCAVRGRPVAATLARSFPEETWESSHLGGDRFAANIALMPDAALYGYVDPDAAVDLIRDHRAGRPQLEHFRGLIGQVPAVQVALTAAAAEFGLLPWDRRLSGALKGAPPRWSVEVRLDGVPAAQVAGHTELRPEAALTCGARPGMAVMQVADAVTRL